MRIARSYPRTLVVTSGLPPGRCDVREAREFPLGLTRGLMVPVARRPDMPGSLSLDLHRAGERLRTSLVRPSRNGARTVEQMLAMFTDDGVDAYVCGGSVRDSLLGLDVYDVDLVVDLPITELRERLVQAFAEESVRIYNPTFGLITVGDDAEDAVDVTMLHDTNDIGPSDTFIMNVAFGGHGRRRDATSALIEDSKSRDLTMNAVYWSPARGFVDPSGLGLEDIAARCIRLCASPAKRRVDPRMSFRMLVFVARGFALSDEAAEFVHARLEVDIESYPREGFAQFIVETVHGRRELAMALLLLARPHVRKESAWRLLENACERV